MPTELAPINLSSTYVGPKPEGRKRDQYPHRLNETISIMDRKFKDTITTTESQNLAFHYKDMIEEHLERRIAVFFQQLVVAYKTKLKFKEGKTSDQGESATALKVMNEQGEAKEKIKRNAAHSSTLPCLIAYNNDEEFVYIKGGDIYRLANSTMEMPRIINEADIAIDASLRGKALEILNECSKGNCDPISGLKRFLNEIKPKKVKNDGVVAVLEIYQKIIKRIKHDIEEDETIFDRLLGIQVEKQERQVAYKIRYKAIREAQLAQAKMIEKINNVSKRVLQKISYKRKPTYYEEAFFQILKNELQEKNKTRLDKLYNSPQESYFRENARRKVLETTKKLIPINEIKDLARELKCDFRDLKRDEIQRRGEVVKTLRCMKNLSQCELASKIKELFPQSASSQATVSRIENNIKLIDRKYAEELAQVFGVDTALFIPAFYWD